MVEEVDRWKRYVESAQRLNIFKDSPSRHSSSSFSPWTLYENARKKISSLFSLSPSSWNVSPHESSRNGFQIRRLDFLNSSLVNAKFIVSRTIEPKPTKEQPQFVVTPIKTTTAPPVARSIGQVLAVRPNSTLVVNNRISVHDLETLQGRSWLNDSIINYYLELLVETALPLRVYAFNSFFLPKLHSTGHEGVKRWTKNVDIFAHRIILWPVHAGGNHWCLALADNHTCRLFYFDSLGGGGDCCLRALQSYLKEQHRIKKETPIEYTLCRFPGYVPHQENGYDCGVFSLSFARDIIRHFGTGNNALDTLKISFSQQHMPSIRTRITQEIIDSHKEAEIQEQSDSNDDLIIL